MSEDDDAPDPPHIAGEESRAARALSRAQTPTERADAAAESFKTARAEREERERVPTQESVEAEVVEPRNNRKDGRWKLPPYGNSPAGGKYGRRALGAYPGDEEADLPDPTTIKGVRKRVLYIADLMSRGLWILRTSNTELAKAWHLSPQRIRQYSAEANRVIKNELGSEDKDLLKVRMVATLDRITRLAMREGKYRDAVEACRAAGVFLGLTPDPTAPQETDQFAEWTREEKLHYAKTGRKPARLGDGSGTQLN